MPYFLFVVIACTAHAVGRLRLVGGLFVLVQSRCMHWRVCPTHQQIGAPGYGSPVVTRAGSKHVDPVVHFQCWFTLHSLSVCGLLFRVVLIVGQPPCWPPFVCQPLQESIQLLLA